MTEITIVAGEKKRKGPVVCGVDELKYKTKSTRDMFS